MKNSERKIAIFTDIHALYEPLEAILEDISNRGITEIYCLGDMIGLGPNPDEVISLLRQNNVSCLAGEDEEYLRLGFEPFNYLSDANCANYTWTASKLSNDNLNYLYCLPSSFDISLGDKKIALCHFGNDVRCDYSFHNIWTYKSNLSKGIGYRQFLYTNSSEQKEELLYRLKRIGFENPKAIGLLFALSQPLFQGKSIKVYDAMIQGHIHSKIHESVDDFDLYSLNGVGVFGFHEGLTSYYILEENENGFDIQEILLPFDVLSMHNSVRKMTMPNTFPIKTLTRI